MMKCNFIMQPGKISVILLKRCFVKFSRFVRMAFYGVYEITYKFMKI